MRRLLLVLAVIAVFFATFAIAQSAEPPGCARAKLRFEVSFAAQQSEKPLDGRVYVLLSTDDDKEPRFQIS